MTSVAVLQARTNSSRLPGKSLLPVGGLPLVVLAAKRAGNTGREILVATSDESSDDVLADTVRAHGVPVFRGSLDSPLDRLVDALADHSDNTVVFRLTGDNVFPDGAFLDELEAHFTAGDMAYLSCVDPGSGLPYGFSAEVTRLKYLREAHAETDSDFDREHVTPFIIRRYGNERYRGRSAANAAHLRATVDQLEDYLTINRIFAGHDDPVTVPTEALVGALAKAPGQSRNYASAARVILGSAQMGMDYGITNTGGQASLAEACGLVRFAATNGVAAIDTARAYGESEAVLGKCLKGGWADRMTVLTKLSPLPKMSEPAAPEDVAAHVDASIFQSCATLGTHTLDGLALHRASHLHSHGGVVWTRLQNHQSEGRINRLGVSVQSPEELDVCLSTESVSFVQMPYNMLDHRWDAVIERLRAVRSERTLEVHARSALLQGLLLSDDPALWQRAGVADAECAIKAMQTLMRRLGLTDRAALCLAYVDAQDWVDALVIGVENVAQLEKNLALLDAHQLDADALAIIRENRPVLAEDALNPATWSR